MAAMTEAACTAMYSLRNLAKIERGEVSKDILLFEWMSDPVASPC